CVARSFVLITARCAGVVARLPSARGRVVARPSCARQGGRGIVGCVRITDVSVVMHERAPSMAAFGPRGAKVPLGVLRVVTDEGIEGNAFLSSPGPGAEALARQVIAVIKPWLVGADPLDIGAHARRMDGLRHYLTPHAI